MIVEIAEAASDLGRFAQRLVKILEVEDGGLVVGGDVVENSASAMSCGVGTCTVLLEAFGQAPGPDGNGRRGEQTRSGFTENAADAVLLGRADVGEGASGLEDLTKQLGCPALDGSLVGGDGGADDGSLELILSSTTRHHAQ